MTQDVRAAPDAEAELEPDEAPLPDDGIAAIAFAGLILILAVVFFFETSSVRSEAAIWPRMLTLGLIVLCSLRIGVAMLSRMRQASVASPAASRGSGWDGPSPAVRRRLFTAGWTLAYAVVAQYAGFGPTMLVFMPVYMWAAGFRRPVWIVAITLGSAVALSLLFGTVVGVPMWEGDL